MKIVHLLLLGALTTDAVLGDCQGHYMKDGRFSLCIHDSDCTHPNNFCSEGTCNESTKVCDGPGDKEEDSGDDAWFNMLMLGRRDDFTDNDMNPFFGDWGVLKLVDKNGTELYGNFDDRIGNITE